MSAEAIQESKNLPIPEIPQLTYEILELVLLQVADEQLLELTYVSKNFNALISGSLRLMKKLPVHWERVNKFMKPEEFPSINRKYRKVYAKDTYPLIRFVESHTSTLITLDFRGCGIDADEIHEILSILAGSLQELSIRETNIYKLVELPTIVMPELVSLEVCEDRRSNIANFLLPLLCARKLKSFNYEESEDCGTSACDVLVKFVDSQTELKNLNVFSLYTSNLVQHFARVSPAKFKASMIHLKIRGLISVEDEDTFSADLVKFVRTQIESLTDFMFANCRIEVEQLEMMLKSPCMKSLMLDECTVTWPQAIKVKSSSIEKFSVATFVEECLTTSVLKSCPHVHTIQFKKVNFIPFELRGFMLRMQLKRLEFDACFDSDGFQSFKFEFSVPTLEELYCANMSYLDVINMIRVNPQLKLVEVCKHYKSIPSFQILLNNFSWIAVKYFAEPCECG